MNAKIERLKTSSAPMPAPGTLTEDVVMSMTLLELCDMLVAADHVGTCVKTLGVGRTANGIVVELSFRTGAHFTQLVGPVRSDVVSALAAAVCVADALGLFVGKLEAPHG